MKPIVIATVTLGAALVLVSGVATPVAAPPAHATLVVCAPGFPGNTEQAKPSMDAFAGEIVRAAGWPLGSLEAIYYETEEAGLARLAGADASYALVPLPFYVQHAADRKLHPLAQVVQEKGSSETWSLVAKKGAVASPASLDGWEVTGTPGYAPGFVRSLVLGGWGEMPTTAKITFTARPLSALRRADAGEKVAVVLDGEQGAALPSLPFAGNLDVVTRSKPLPGTILCTAGDHADKSQGEKLADVLLHLHQTPSGADVLKALRMTRFERADPAALEALLKLAAPR